MRCRKTWGIWVGALILVGSAACERDVKVLEPVQDDPNAPRRYFLEVPQNFPEMPIPEDNLLTVEGVALGRKLFFDPILSRDNTQSCGSCHNQEWGFTDNGRKVSVGIDGIAGTRNSMALINLGWADRFFWDGRNVSLEEQALEPVPNPIEMHQEWLDAMDKLNTHPEYPALFQKAFGVEFIDSLVVAKAIAQFERTLISGNSRYDRVQRGEEQLTELERIGEGLFFTERADCFHCHGTILFTDNAFHNNGLQDPIVDSGLGALTGRVLDQGAFKSPTLRNIDKTGPYMHDGRFQTLEEVIEFYNSGVNQSGISVDPLMKKANRPNGSLGLNELEKRALVAFLKTLTDNDFLENEEFSDPNQ